MQWFRVYSEILDDPKVAKMDGETFRCFVYLLALSSELGNNGIINMSVSDISWRIRIPVNTLEQAIAYFVKNNILTKEDDSFVITNWKKRQFASDDIGQRVKRYREKQRNVTSNVIDTDTDTDTDTEKTHVAKNGNDANINKKKESDFEVFWKAYPNKTEKKYTLKCWKKLNSTRPPIEELLEAIRKQTEWREKANGEFRPEWKNPATWLNKGCWDDELKTGGQNDGNRYGAFGSKQSVVGKAKSDGQPYPVDIECNE